MIGEIEANVRTFLDEHGIAGVFAVLCASVAMGSIIALLSVALENDGVDSVEDFAFLSASLTVRMSLIFLCWFVCREQSTRQGFWLAVYIAAVFALTIAFGSLNEAILPLL